MNRVIRITATFPVLLLLTGLWTGCADPNQSTQVAYPPPYAGGMPPPIAKLPEPVRRLPPRQTVAGAEPGWMPPRGGISKRWECIVIHHSASDKSTPQGMEAYHVRDRGWDALGYHFVIGNGVKFEDGRVHVGERWTRQMIGAHCKVPGNYYNEHGIGICLIGNLEHHAPTARQISSLAKLASFLSGRCGIPKSRILTHGGVTGKTQCPGRRFTLAPVLRQMTIPGVSVASDPPELLDE